MYYKWPKFPIGCKTFVFDTNILMYMHGFMPNGKNAAKFAPLVEYIIANKFEVYIDKVVFGEFINRYVTASMGAKLEQTQQITKSDLFKFDKTKHRSTNEYKLVLKEINNILCQIQSSYNIIWMPENHKIDPSEAVAAMDRMEFNDYLIMSLAKENKATLVTNDNDLIGHPEINTISA